MKELIFLMFFVYVPFALVAADETTHSENAQKYDQEKNEKIHPEVDQHEESKNKEMAGTKSSEKESNNEKKGNETGGTTKGAEEAEQTLKIGNLAFPPSQQPSPLISFGQNIINRKEMQIQTVVTDFQGDRQYFINIIPGLLYAFTDSFSIFLVSPFAVRYRDEHHHSSGPGDFTIQLEYAFYTKAHRTYYDQATIVANVTIPTGSFKKDPPTGVGSNSYFIGGTYSRMEINWFYFASSGGVFTGSSHRSKHGEQFLYQFGIGRRITSTSEWLLDWMVEFDGTYSWKDRIHGKTNPDSGGNIIYMTPSIWFSTKDTLFFQCGIGVPIQQHLFGKQNKNRYLLIMNTGWLF